MSRKHYVLLASSLRFTRLGLVAFGPDVLNNFDAHINAVALVCAQCNKLFDRDRFLTASNYKGLNDE